MGRKHNLDEVIRSLSKKRDIQIDTRKKVLEILNPGKNQDLGNKSWGKIDYLVNYAGYIKLFVSEFSRV